MAMTLDQAQQLVQQTSNPDANATPTPGPFTTSLPPGGTAVTAQQAGSGSGFDTGTGSDGTASGAPNYQLDPTSGLWYDMNTGTVAPQWIQNYLNTLQGNGAPPKNDLTGLYPYNPQTGQIGKYPITSPTGGPGEENWGPITTLIDPSTGILYDANGKMLPEYLQKSLGAGVGNGGGGGGGISAAQQAQIGYDYANLAENKRQFDIQQALAQQQANQGYVQSRASAGLTLGDLANKLAEDQYNYAKDPGNYPAYLAMQAGLPQGSGSPITSLLGQGVQIAPPAGSNPLADPRFQNLMDQLYGYAQPQSLQTVQNIAAQNGGQLPQSFYDYTHTQAPSYAGGGTQMLNEPVIGIGLHSGQPKFLAGEAGQERLTFEPVHNHSAGGMPTPHSHAQGDQQHEHNADGSMMQDMRKYADGGTAQTSSVDGAYGGDSGNFTHHQLVSAYNAYHPNAQMADNIYTPAEASAISLGKALSPLGYVPRDFINYLQTGRAPTPGMLSEQWYNRIPASLRDLLGTTVQSFLGSSGLQDFNDALTHYAMPGQSSYTQTAYL